MAEYERKTDDEIIAELGRRFREPARDRRIYAILGTYAQLDVFTPRIRELCEKHAFSDAGQEIPFFDLNHALLEHLQQQGKLDQATDLADRLRNKELVRLMEDGWKRWLSSSMQSNLGLVLAGFELFFSYLDANALALVRQYAINGKHLCLVLPAVERDGLVWAFNETPAFRRQITGLVAEWTYVIKEEV
jgi:hypothetical protein